MLYLKKIIKTFNITILVLGLLIPLVLFANRFLIPDVSFDSINYHLYLGFKNFNLQNNQFELYPTGIHNFSPILDAPGYVLMNIFGYKVGSIGSLIFLYLSIFILYKIFRLYKPKFYFLDKWWFGFIFVSMFLSFESFLQIATYYIDIEVAFLMLLSTYFLFKYEKSEKLTDLIFSSLSMSVFVLGKMTTWYFLFPYFAYLIFILILNKKKNVKQKIFIFLLSAVISISLVLPWLYQNFTLTNNPVFPFYNGFFKSEYFVKTNFSQIIFGGRNFFEKFFWGIVSIKDPVRLGEVHDLFTDYKINILFITSLFVFVWSFLKRNIKMLKISVFYLVLYFSWSYFFGYLRYGLILEFLGGLILLMWFCEMKTFKKYLIIIPIVLIMLIQGKKIISMSLAYDVSFRPGYFYNRSTYLKEIPNLKNNKIRVDVNIINKHKPNVYFNCIVPSMTYYVLSEFNNLPVINIDSRANSGIVLDPEYNKALNLKTNDYLDGSKLRFVTITTKEGHYKDYVDCMENLQSKNYRVNEEIIVDDFLGYEGQSLVYIFGEYSL